MQLAFLHQVFFDKKAKKIFIVKVYGINRISGFKKQLEFWRKKTPISKFDNNIILI